MIFINLDYSNEQVADRPPVEKGDLKFSYLIKGR